LAGVKPNVLLVVLDAARRDALEPYGGPEGSTPAIADLARRGHAAARVYATGSWTLASHASMFGGLLPRELGLSQPPGSTAHSVQPVLERLAGRLLPEVLRRDGYATHAYSSNLWISETVGFDVGFESFEYVPGDRASRLGAVVEGGRRARISWALDGLSATADDGAAEIGQRLRRSIAGWSGQPTLWFVNLVECHSPYLPPRPWNDLPVVERVRAADDARRFLNFEAICLYVAGRLQIPSESLERMRHLYRQAVSYMDHWLAGILEALDRQGILEQTLVIVTSDHGENLGEAGLIAHGFSLDERLIHVPFVSAGPGALLDDRVVSLARLPGHIAQACGLQEHPWSADEPAVGLAVAQYDPMGSADDQRVRAFTERWQLAEEEVGRLTPTITAATDGRHKLVIRDGARRLYDLERDPGEHAPLELDPADETVRMLLCAARSGSAPSEIASIPAPDRRAPSAEELAALERQMKLLGYM
jgi:arylsulfatase A-like enzyme